MKIRMGFVSNSSSSSFCIVGVIVDRAQFGSINEVRRLYVQAGGDIDDIRDMDLGATLCELWNMLPFDREKQVFGNLMVNAGIETYSSDEYIIGRPIEHIRDDQTMGDFKQTVLDDLRRFGFKGSVSDLDIYIDGGYSE